MEFFQKIENVDIETVDLKKLLTLNQLPILCSAIDTVSAEQENNAEIYCIWGAFDIRRDEIRHGVRFSLLNCPHALMWTITYDKDNKAIIVHCTIDKTEQEADFVESINLFVEEWSSGISRSLQHIA